MNLTGKKLLILGGTTLNCEILYQAKKQGATVYVTDYLEDSPAKIIADKSFMTSAIDADAIVELIKKENIDGVLTGFIDMLLPYLYDICQKAGLPCYIASKDQITATTEKDNFKALCKKFDIPVVSEYVIQAPFTVENTQHVQFPVLIKPVDNSGARGIFICRSLEELQENYPKALTFSKSKQILIERYITANEATAFYLMQDGKIVLSAMGDRHMKKFQEGIIPLPVAYTFPAKQITDYQQKLDAKVVAMFESIGIKNGMIFIQMFVDDEEFVFYEMGYRLTGSLEYKIIEKVSGINPMQCMVNYALTGNMTETDITQQLNPVPSEWGANVTILMRPGKIASIKGLEEVKNNPQVLDVLPSYAVGETIPTEALGTLQQVFARAFIVAETKEQLADLIQLIQNEIEVLDENGQSLLIEGFDTKELVAL